MASSFAFTLLGDDESAILRSRFMIRLPMCVSKELIGLKNSVFTHLIQPDDLHLVLIKQTCTFILCVYSITICSVFKFKKIENNTP